MYQEGNIISFTELGDEYQGIILERRKDSSLIVFDIYGNIKTIYKEDVISTDIQVNIDSINNLLNYYNHHLDEKRQEETIIQYQMELNKINEKYREKINNVRWKIENIKKSKEDIIENLDIYTYSKLNERFNEILNNKATGYEIVTDFTHSVTSVVFNRLYTLAEEGTFDKDKLDFISYHSDGTPYIQEQEYWSIEARSQANSLIKEIDEYLKIDKKLLCKTDLEIEDRIIYGGAIKDLTLSRNYKFIPKNDSNKKDNIDEIFTDIGNFAKEYLIEADADKEVIFPWQEGYNAKDNESLFPWRNK